MSEGSAHLVNTFWLMCVAALWGGTNPFIKEGSKGIEKIKHNNPVKQFLLELIFLFSNWKYLLPFLINQSGSVVFYITLSSADLSLAVPLTNSLTFIFTSISSKVMGEDIGNWETHVGMVLVLIGVTLCVFSKL